MLETVFSPKVNSSVPLTITVQLPGSRTKLIKVEVPFNVLHEAVQYKLHDCRMHERLDAKVVSA